MLSVENLNRPSDDPKQQPLLSGISLHLKAGLCAVISGSSGAGKTLLLRSLVDLDPNQGQVSMNGNRRDTMVASVWRAMLCYVPAEPAWWGDHVKDHFPDLAQAKKTGALLGLKASLFDHPVTQLSTGERQRAALVRALAVSPAVLLLDEPTAALDPHSTAMVEEALAGFMENGNSVILVSHDEAQGKRIGNDFYIMTDGQLDKVAKR